MGAKKAMSGEKIHKIGDLVLCRIGSNTSVKTVTDFKTITMADGSLHYMYKLDWKQWVSADCLSPFANDDTISKMCNLQKYLSGNLDNTEK